MNISHTNAAPKPTAYENLTRASQLTSDALAMTDSLPREASPSTTREQRLRIYETSLNAQRVIGPFKEKGPNWPDANRAVDELIDANWEITTTHGVDPVAAAHNFRQAQFFIGEALAAVGPSPGDS